MVDHAHALAVLLGRDNILWREETKHEAMLLMRTLYEKSNEYRNQIVSYILKGPPAELLDQGDENPSDPYIFELLSFLEKGGLPLGATAVEKLKAIKERHPSWSHPCGHHVVEEGWHQNKFSVEDVLLLAPGDVPIRIIEHKETWERPRRDLCEMIGVAIARKPDWGVVVWRAIQSRILDMPENSLNPILLGIRAALNDKTSTLHQEHVEEILTILEPMPNIRSSPELWSSLPRILAEFLENFGIPIEKWNKLATRLLWIYESFDYDRKQEGVPVEWIQRAINHPLGDLTQLYIKVAQKHVRDAVADGRSYSLEVHSERFFSHVLKHYSTGTRYGLCLLAERLSWIEAIAPEFAREYLFPAFEWTDDSEKALVAWSGYLWSRALSRSLTERFKSTYLESAPRHRQFASAERKGLATHVAGIFWFAPDHEDQLFEFASLVDADIRVGVLNSWQQHLANAEPDIAERFFEKIIFPYWDWCLRQEFFDTPGGDRGRFEFWELLPSAFGRFPEASRRAIKASPSKIEHMGLFVENLNSEKVLEYPTDLVELLIALIEIDAHPFWHEQKWQIIWEKIKLSGVPRLKDLENALARKNISLT